MAPELHKQVSDVQALRALASPVRRRLLHHLMAAGPQTASACSVVVGATPSNCSYHLRQLERYGLVERAEASGPDGRDRPWHPAATGLSYGPPHDDAGPPDAAAALAHRRLLHAGVDDDADLLHASVDAHDAQPPEWRRAEIIASYGLMVTAEELVTLTTAVDALLRPYISLTREGAPPEADRVHVVFDAVRRPGVRGAG